MQNQFLRQELLEAVVSEGGLQPALEAINLTFYHFYKYCLLEPEFKKEVKRLSRPRGPNRRSPFEDPSCRQAFLQAFLKHQKISLALKEVGLASHVYYYYLKKNPEFREAVANYRAPTFSSNLPKQQEFLSHLESGKSIKEACLLMGLSQTTISNYRQSNPSFSQKIRRLLKENQQKGAVARLNSIFSREFREIFLENLRLNKRLGLNLKKLDVASKDYYQYLTINPEFKASVDTVLTEIKEVRTANLNSPQTRQRFLAEIRARRRISAACQAVGIKPQDYKDYIAKNKNFSKKVAAIIESLKSEKNPLKEAAARERFLQVASQTKGPLYEVCERAG